MSIIDLTLERAHKEWSDFEDTGNEMMVDSIVLNLHAAYNGLEVWFESIARTVDQHRPQGERWHQELLSQMAKPIEDVRPAVISYDSCQMLSNYCRFRHVVRHTYPIEIKISPVKEHLDYAVPTFEQAKAELLAFAEMLSKLDSAKP